MKDFSSLQKQTEIPTVVRTIQITAQRNVFSQLLLLSYQHGIGCDEPSVLWAFGAIDGMTVKTDEATLLDVL